jgi:hypothetical protein
MKTSDSPLEKVNWKTVNWSKNDIEIAEQVLPKIEMCPCCGYEHKIPRCPACGFVDHMEYEVTTHRANWIKGGFVWHSIAIAGPKTKPKNWNPVNTLARLALKTTRARTKGRPARLNPL